MVVSNVIVCFMALLVQISAELVLEKDVAETVTFHGSELEIKVDNIGGVEGSFILCIKSSDQVSSPDCPTGYQRIKFYFGYASAVQTFKMERQGKVTTGVTHITTIAAIAFNDDDALEVILKEIPSQSTKVRLLNAERYVPMEPMTTATPKNSNSGPIKIVVIVLLAIAGLLIIVLIAIICYCRRRTPQNMEQSKEQDQKHKTQLVEGRSAPKPNRQTSSTTVTTITLSVKPLAAAPVFPSSQSTQKVPSVSATKQATLKNTNNLHHKNSSNYGIDESASITQASNRR